MGLVLIDLKRNAPSLESSAMTKIPSSTDSELFTDGFSSFPFTSIQTTRSILKGCHGIQTCFCLLHLDLGTSR